MDLYCLFDWYDWLSGEYFWIMDFVVVDGSLCVIVGYIWKVVFLNVGVLNYLVCCFDGSICWFCIVYLGVKVMVFGKLCDF